MKVAELIEKLSTLNPETEVFCYNSVAEEYQSVEYAFENNTIDRKYTKDGCSPEPDHHVVLVGGKSNMDCR